MPTMSQHLTLLQPFLPAVRTEWHSADNKALAEWPQAISAELPVGWQCASVRDQTNRTSNASCAFQPPTRFRMATRTRDGLGLCMLAKKGEHRLIHCDVSVSVTLLRRDQGL